VLVVLIAVDPVKISRRSPLFRALSIALVSLLVFGAMWATVQLI
jgi:hypothetical protein